MNFKEIVRKSKEWDRFKKLEKQKNEDSQEKLNKRKIVTQVYEDRLEEYFGHKRAKEVKYNPKYDKEIEELFMQGYTTKMMFFDKGYDFAQIENAVTKMRYIALKNNLKRPTIKIY